MSWQILKFSSFSFATRNINARPWLLTQDALTLSTALEPLRQARSMKTIATSFTLQSRHLSSFWINHSITHRTRFHTFIFLIHILLPKHQRIQYTSAFFPIEHAHDLQSPSSITFFWYTNCFIRINLDVAKWEVRRDLDNHLKRAFVLYVRRNEFAARYTTRPQYHQDLLRHQSDFARWILTKHTKSQNQNEMQ